MYHIDFSMYNHKGFALDYYTVADLADEGWFTQLQVGDWAPEWNLVFVNTPDLNVACKAVCEWHCLYNHSEFNVVSTLLSKDRDNPRTPWRKHWTYAKVQFTALNYGAEPVNAQIRMWRGLVYPESSQLLDTEIGTILCDDYYCKRLVQQFS